MPFEVKLLKNQQVSLTPLILKVLIVIFLKMYVT